MRQAINLKNQQKYQQHRGTCSNNYNKQVGKMEAKKNMEKVLIPFIKGSREKFKSTYF